MQLIRVAQKGHRVIMGKLTEKLVVIVELCSINWLRVTVNFDQNFDVINYNL